MRVQQAGLPSYLHHPSCSSENKSSNGVKGRKAAVSHSPSPGVPCGPHRREHEPAAATRSARPLVCVGRHAKPALPVDLSRSRRPSSSPAACPGNATFLRDSGGVGQGPPASPCRSLRHQQSPPLGASWPRTTATKPKPPQNPGQGG